MKMIVLDRDGVINHDSDHFIRSAAEWQPIAGSLEAIARLKRAGFKVVVATNQSGIGRGLFDRSALEAIHDKMIQALAAFDAKFDGIYYCPHHPDDHCDCRKPKPGMLVQIANNFNLDYDQLLIIGDSWRDLQAAQAVGSPSFLVKTGKGSKTLLKYANFLSNSKVFNNLAAASNDLLLSSPTMSDRRE